MKISKLSAFFVLIPGLISLAASGVFASEQLGKRILLNNGMVLLLAEKHTIPMVTISMAMTAGKTAEPAGKAGLAALTASLLTQGTSRRTAQQISSEIDFIGGSLSTSGGDDFASANVRVLKKDLRTGLDLLSDVLLHPVFDQKEIDRKIKETLAETQRQQEEPAIVASNAFDKAVFGDNAYGRTSDDVAASLPKLTRDDVVAFYSARYSPNHSVIAVVGDVSEKEIVALLNEFFRSWLKTEQPLPAPVQPPILEKTVVEKIDKNITQANIAMGHIGISRENPDFYACLVMNYILGGGGFSSRLMDNIRDNKGLAYDVHSGFEAQKDPGAFMVSIQTKNESANEVIAETIKEIRRIQSELVSEKELKDAKAYLTGNFPLRMDTSAKIAGILTSIEIYNLGLDYPQKYPGLINSVTREDIQRVAKKYLFPDSMAIIVVANQEKAKLKY
ncbi:MAG TPA: pitrilysin family protein [Nitrospirota bacterium]|nr:pitrilysin family protein [Nitrospirota bacterium]